MPNLHPDHGDREILPHAVAERLLARASVLDATNASGSTVAALRAAAMEAGISAGAFDAALAEVREERAPAPAPEAGARPRRGVRMWAIAAAIVAVLAGVRLVVPAGPDYAPAAPPLPMVEEPVLLQCLSPGEAAELIRPFLDLPQNSVEYRREAPRVLTIRGTPDQIETARSVLERYESAGSATCARPLPPPA